MRNPVWPSSCLTPAGTSNELDVRNESEENTHTHTSSTLLYSSIIRFYPQNPVFEIVHDKGVKVYLHMYNGNVKQNPLCVESCVAMYSFHPRSHCR